VNEFIQHSLPDRCHSPATYRCSRWITHRAPNTPVTLPFLLPIPSGAVLKGLQSNLKTYEGAEISICDPRADHPDQSYPIWIVPFWVEVAKVIEHQELWKSSLDWLASVNGYDEVVQQAKANILTLPWNAPLRMGPASSIQLASFLGESWLSDIQVDMMTWVLQARVEQEGHTSVRVEPTIFTWEAESVARQRAKNTPNATNRPRLVRVAKGIREGIETIWFPIHVNKNHWITGMLDATRSTLAFGKAQSCTTRVT
jgi:hypothetical protein